MNTKILMLYKDKFFIIGVNKSSSISTASYKKCLYNYTVNNSPAVAR